MNSQTQDKQGEENREDIQNQVIRERGREGERERGRERGTRDIGVYKEG